MDPIRLTLQYERHQATGDFPMSKNGTVPTHARVRRSVWFTEVHAISLVKTCCMRGYPRMA